MHYNVPTPPTSWNGRGDTGAGRRSAALLTTLAILSPIGGAPVLAEEHKAPTASETKKNDGFKLPTVPNLPVPSKPNVPVAPGDAAKTGNTGKAGDTTKVASPPPLDPKVDPKGVLNQALKAYESGHYGQAASLLANDLQANPDDGTVHYYMGLALKKQGYDMKALHELEKAARLCPPEMIKRFADEQIGNLDEPEPVENAAAKPAAPAPGDWLSGIGNSINQMFGGKPAPQANATTTGTAAAGSTTAATTSGGSALSFFPSMPDVMGQIKDAVKQGKKMIRQQQGKDKEAGGSGTSHADFSRWQVGEAEIMHMDEMQALVQKSHGMHVPDWASSSEGVVAYEQAPEGTLEWDYWIGRFKRCFQHVLMRRLNSEAGNEVRGAAACIFSVDRAGNLRGQVYASTADPLLNKCLVEAVRDLNHSRVLAFPTTSHITGWNFQMSWNFGVYLAIVKAYKAQQEREATIQALLKLVKEDTAIKATIAAGKEKRAKAKKLAAEKALKAKMIKPAPEAKAEVSGQIVTPGAERELKAVALELKDLTPVAPNDASQPNIDPFATIDDQTINKWPDLNR